MILEAEKGPATPSTVLFEAASPKSTVIRSGPKKKVRVDSPVEVRRCLFNSPSGVWGTHLWNLKVKKWRSLVGKHPRRPTSTLMIFLLMNFPRPLSSRFFSVQGGMYFLHYIKNTSYGRPCRSSPFRILMDARKARPCLRRTGMLLRMSRPARLGIRMRNGQPWRGSTRS